MDPPRRIQNLGLMKKTPLISDIQGNSLDDGPGIRSLIFFKGCPLSCRWCQNPESKNPDPELAFDAQKCVACDSCMEKCPEGALSRDNVYFVDRARCTLCFECVKVCPSGALSRAGREYTVEEVTAAVAKDQPFYEASGGGVTLSGGEPTMHLEFLSGLLAALKNKGIHTLIETCGWFNFDQFQESALPFTDAVYLDIKLFDADEHQRYCGVDNQVILENFIKLHELSLSRQLEIVARVPLIPDITDREHNLEAIARFFREHGVKQIRLLPNNPTWHPKCLALGYESPFGEDSPMRKWLPPEKMEACRNIFLANSLMVV